MVRGRKKRARRDEPTRDTHGREAQEIERLRQENERLRKQLEEQAKRIADLEHQLALKHQNSTRTSKPPSSDGLAGQQRARGRRVKGRRKAGGQPGHPGRHRELVPVERVHAIVDLAPEPCRQCARRLHARHTVGDPRRHQVTELPPIAAHITEYRCHRRQCPACDTITLAPLPDEHATQFGPQLTALIAYLTVVCRMPRLVVQRFLEGALQIPISLGSTQNAWEETSAAVAAPYAHLEAAVRHEPVVNADETGHRTNGEKRWLWTFVARTFVLYRIAASRGSDVLQLVLGETFAGILGSDRLPAYLKYVVGQRQLCWAQNADVQNMPTPRDRVVWLRVARARTMSTYSQGLKKREQRVGWLVTAGAGLQRRGPRECLVLEREVGVQVHLGGLQLLVTEPQRND
jgi:transposase